MNIGLIDVDSHNFPNLALMKISSHHKAKGDDVEWWNGLKYYDKVYMSKVFSDTYTKPMEFCINADEVYDGGTGGAINTVDGEEIYSKPLDPELPCEIECSMPDYSLYGITDTAFGFLTRGCPNNCEFCIVSKKEGRKSQKVADLCDFWNTQDNIKLMDPNLLASKDHMELLGQLAESKAKVDFTQGIDARLLNEENINALNQINTQMIHFAWDSIKQSDKILKGLNLYSKLGNVDRWHRTVYVLINKDTTEEEDLYRIYHLREMDFDPYVMIYNKPEAPKRAKDIQRWVNSKPIWRTCKRFEDYKALGGKT